MSCSQFFAQCEYATLIRTSDIYDKKVKSMRNPKTVKKDVMPLSVRVQHGDRKQYSRHQPATAERMKMRLEEQVTLG